MGTITDGGSVHLLTLLLKKLFEMASNPSCTILALPSLKELILINYHCPPIPRIYFQVC